MRKLAWLLVLIVGCSKPTDAPPGDHVAHADPAPDRSAAAAGSAHHRKHEDRREPVVADASPLQLQITVNGAPATWHQDAFDKVARYTKGNDGEARDVWSLRQLVHDLVGPNARVASVTGDDGTRVIDATTWRSEARTPLLHTTRRGTLKFRWADGDGTWGESEVKDVIRIEVVP